MVAKKPGRALAPKSAESDFGRGVQGMSKLPITYIFEG
jgi:hypothetical protein